MLSIIREKIPTEELLAQMAEEAVELSHAALKLRRVMDGSNPTPVRLSEAYASLEEEIADVLLCLETLGYNMQMLTRYRAMMDVKLARWVDRIMNMDGDGNA